MLLFSYAKIIFQTLIAIDMQMIPKKLLPILGLMLITNHANSQNANNDSFKRAMEAKDSVIDGSMLHFLSSLLKRIRFSHLI